MKLKELRRLYATEVLGNLSHQADHRVEVLKRQLDEEREKNNLLIKRLRASEKHASQSSDWKQRPEIKRIIASSRGILFFCVGASLQRITPEGLLSTLWESEWLLTCGSMSVRNTLIVGVCSRGVFKLETSTGEIQCDSECPPGLTLTEFKSGNSSEKSMYVSDGKTVYETELGTSMYTKKYHMTNCVQILSIGAGSFSTLLGLSSAGELYDFIESTSFQGRGCASVGVVETAEGFFVRAFRGKVGTARLQLIRYDGEFELHQLADFTGHLNSFVLFRPTGICYENLYLLACIDEAENRICVWKTRLDTHIEIDHALSPENIAVRELRGERPTAARFLSLSHTSAILFVCSLHHFAIVQVPV